MTVDNFIDNVNNLIKDIANGLPGTMQTIGNDAIALIKLRIQQKGEDAEGNKLPPYSTTEVPAFFFYNKATNESGRKIIKERQKEKRGLSYLDFKAANNGSDSVSHRNYTFTGDMFRNLKIIEQGDTPQGYAVKIAGGTDEADKKFEYNSKRDGDVLRVSKEEEELFAETLDSELQKLIDQNGF